MKKQFCIALLFLLLPLLTMGRQSENDKLISMYQAMRKAPNDTLLMDSYRELGFYFQNNDGDSSLYYHQLQLALAKKLKLKLWEADAYQQIGYTQAILLNFSESLLSFLEGFKIAEDKTSEGNAWNVRRFSFSKTPTEARLSILGMLHHDIHRLYYATGKYKKEKENILKALQIGDSINNKKLLILSTRALGEYLFIHDPQSDSALYYLIKALELYATSDYQLQKGRLLESLGKYFISTQEYDSAKHYFQWSIQINNEQSQLESLAPSYLRLGEVYLIKGVMDSSLYFTNKGLQVAEQSNQFSSAADGNLQLFKIYKEQGKFNLAAQYLEKSKAINDSINTAYIEKLLQFQNIIFDEQLARKENEKIEIEQRNKLRTYSFIGGTFLFIAIGLLMYRNNRQKTKANNRLEKTLQELKSTQSQLIQSEKMASLGELTAGIAHEIQNPLNFVNNFSEVSTELVDEMKTELATGNLELATEISNDLKQNLEKINHHGKRAGEIVKGMLQHSRVGSGQKEPTDINALCDEYLRLAYHGLRAKDKSFNASMNTDFDESLEKINVIPQDIGRVILNLITNAFYVVNEKANNKQLATSQPAGQAGNESYEPTVSVSTKKDGGKILISVKDNGNGIPEHIKEKIFQPFFTTKPTGQGTGLGLSLSYDIVKAHGGELRVETKENEGSEFVISLPVA